MVKYKPQVGCPPHRPTVHTRGKVISFAAAGFTQQNIADYLQLDLGTLKRHYREELDNSTMMRVAKVANNLFLNCMKGDVRAQEFFLKTRGRWSTARPEEEDKNAEKVASLLEQLVEQGKKPPTTE